MTEIPKIEIIGINGIPEISQGDDLTEAILSAAENMGFTLYDGDNVVVTQKIVSKSAGRLVSLLDVSPSDIAIQYAVDMGKDPRLMELVLQESKYIVRMDMKRGILITETKHGFICANAGIDSSNVPGSDIVCLLPIDSNASARGLRRSINIACGVDIAVVITDTFGRAWREGHTTFAIGVSGIDPMLDYRGTIEANGRLLKATTIAIADEIAAASELATAKSDNIPVVVIRGYDYPHNNDSTVDVMLRDIARDLFR